MSTKYQVRATPTGNDVFSVECNVCGPIAVAQEAETDECCLQHLEFHGVDTSPWRNKEA